MRLPVPRTAPSAWAWAPCVGTAATSPEEKQVRTEATGEATGGGSLSWMRIAASSVEGNPFCSADGRGRKKPAIPRLVRKRRGWGSTLIRRPVSIPTPAACSAPSRGPRHSTRKGPRWGSIMPVSGHLFAIPGQSVRQLPRHSIYGTPGCSKASPREARSRSGVCPRGTPKVRRQKEQETCRGLPGASPFTIITSTYGFLGCLRRDCESANYASLIYGREN